jgi:hypothetical protein
MNELVLMCQLCSEARIYTKFSPGFTKNTGSLSKDLYVFMAGEAIFIVNVEYFRMCTLFVQRESCYEHLEILI